MIAGRKVLGAGGCVVLLATVGACSQPGSTATAPPTSSGTTPSHPAQTRTTPTPRPPSSSPPSHAPATEFHPPGDIPDNQVFVDYRVPDSTVHIKVPEGWARSSAGAKTTFTSSFNSISIQVAKQQEPPTVASAVRVDVPQIKSSVAQFAPGPVTTIQRQGGQRSSSPTAKTPQPTL